jgi:glutathione S-transferase
VVQRYVQVSDRVYVKSWMKAEPDMSIVKEADPDFHKAAKMLEHQLSQTKFLVGNEPTIADFAVASEMHANVNQGLPWDNYPNLKRWMKEGIEPLPGGNRHRQLSIRRSILIHMAAVVRLV